MSIYICSTPTPVPRSKPGASTRIRVPFRWPSTIAFGDLLAIHCSLERTRHILYISLYFQKLQRSIMENPPNPYSRLYKRHSLIQFSSPLPPPCLLHLVCPPHSPLLHLFPRYRLHRLPRSPPLLPSPPPARARASDRLGQTALPVRDCRVTRPTVIFQVGE